MRIIFCAAAALALAAVASPASASLSVFKTFVGSYGLSTDGGGSTTNSYDISAFAPVGAVVEGAWLYQSNFNFNGSTPYAISLDGNAQTFGPSVVNGTDCCGLNSARADVTAIVKAKVDGGAGGTYNFAVLESDAQTDGTALVVVYSLASLSKSTVAILDGFSDVGGDGFTVSFGSALDPSAAGFQADLRLGIGFSCCGQANTIKVNGTTITENAGNNDDSVDANLSNGNLITVGGNNDPFSALLPSYEDDHERYNLTPYITLGDTSIKVETLNPSADDNIFLAAFLVSGEGVVVTPGIPEPATWAMLIAGFGMVGFTARRRRSALASA